ncbi:MAG: GerMN domain-containing protein [Lachnospiraceae bacterium]|nr:GerMN domain-containing protein [Lachnospiraceae bacterium]
MSKKRVFPALLILLTVLLSVNGCGREEEESTSYTIYYKNSAGTSLYEVSYVPSAETFDEMMAELMAQLSEVPADAAYVSALPSTVAYQGYERGIDALRVDFSSEYYDMDNTTEVLLRAAVVKTICQIPGVTRVMITVDSTQLVDANGEAVAAMDAESFIDTKNGGINSYQTASLILYFPNQDGTMLKKEVRNVHYSSNMVLERVIVEQLIAGSEYSNRKAVLNSNTEILDINTKDGVCTINFSEQFNTAPTENTPSAEAALYAIVNSICETSDEVESVKLTVEGLSNVTFWDEIDLSGVFTLNQDIIETETLESESELAGAQASDSLVSDEAISESGAASAEMSGSDGASENLSDPNEAADGSDDSSDAESGTDGSSADASDANDLDSESEIQSEIPVGNDQVLAGAD